MTNVYKIKLFRWDFKEKDHCNKYCIENNKIGWGWKNRFHPELQIVKNLEDYYPKEEIKKGIFGGNKSKLKTAVENAKDMHKGDWCWTYGTKDGKRWEWFLGKIEGDGFLCGRCTPDDMYKEIGMLRDCNWHPIDLDFVPGSIATFTHDYFTLSLLSKDNGYVQYCDFLYQNWNRLEQTRAPNCGISFWSLTHPDDLEDLVGMYLQTHGYYVFPSTNKKGTKDYEYKLIWKDSTENARHEAIIQCKNNKYLDKELWNKFETGCYKDLDIYILTIQKDPHPEETRYTRHPDNEIFQWSHNGDRIKVFNKENLYQWAIKPENYNILPKRIQRFLDLSKQK